MVERLSNLDPIEAKLYDDLMSCQVGSKEYQDQMQRITDYTNSKRSLQPQPKSSAFPTEEVTQPKELEPISRFSPEARKALEKKRFEIYTLEGTSTQYWRKHGWPLSFSGHRDYEPLVGSVLEHNPSRRSEIAFKAFPSKEFFVDYSSMRGKSVEEHLELLRGHFVPRVLKGIPDIDVDMGSTSDWVEATFRRIDERRKYLFEATASWGTAHLYTRTADIVPKADGINDYNVVVGNFSRKKVTKLLHPFADHGLDIQLIKLSEPNFRVKLAPLIVPKNK